MFLKKIFHAAASSGSRLYCSKTDSLNSELRSGDKCKAKILTGEEYFKDNNVFHAIGAAEELLGFLGLVKEHAVDSHHEYADKLKRIQTIVIEITTSISKKNFKSDGGVTETHVAELVEWTDTYAKELPPPEQYIIPGGGITSTIIHISRAICRRTERHVIPFIQEGTLNPIVQIYLNRLGDFLFTLSRIASKRDKEVESIYIPKNNHKLQEQ